MSAQDQETVGPMLRAMRQGVGWTLTEMASRLGVSKSTLSRVERNERFASPEWLERVPRVVADEIHVRRRARQGIPA